MCLIYQFLLAPTNMNPAFLSNTGHPPSLHVFSWNVTPFALTSPAFTILVIQLWSSCGLNTAPQEPPELPGSFVWFLFYFTSLFLSVRRTGMIPGTGLVMSEWRIWPPTISVKRELQEKEVVLGEKAIRRWWMMSRERYFIQDKPD